MCKGIRCNYWETQVPPVTVAQTCKTHGVCVCLPSPHPDSLPAFPSSFNWKQYICKPVFRKSSMLQENVAWLKMSQTARTLLAIGVVAITGFRQLFYYVVALLRLWINQGLCQIGWKSKVKADHALVSLSFVLSLPSQLHLLAQHSVEQGDSFLLLLLKSSCRKKLQWSPVTAAQEQTLLSSPASLPGGQVLLWPVPPSRSGHFT